ISVQVVKIYRAAHTYQSHHASDGDIDTAGNHDDAQTAGRDDQSRVVVQKVAEGLNLQEAFAQEDHGTCIHRHKHNNCNQEQLIGICHASFRHGFALRISFSCHLCGLLSCSHFLSDGREFCLYSRSADNYQHDYDYFFVCRQSIGGNLQLVQGGGQELNDIGAQYRRHNVEFTAAQRVSTQSHRQDGVHLDILGDNGIVNGGDTAGLNQTYHSHAQAQDNEAQELDKGRIDTVQSGGAGIDTYRLGIQAQVCKF